MEKNKPFRLNRIQILGLLLIAGGIGLTFFFHYDDQILKGNGLLADRQYQACIDMNKNSIWADTAISHYQQAIGYMGLNKLDEALEHINLTLKKEENFQSVRLKGHILQRLGQEQEAGKYFHRSEYLKAQSDIAMEQMQQQQPQMIEMQPNQAMLQRNQQFFEQSMGKGKVEEQSKSEKSK